MQELRSKILPQLLSVQPGRADTGQLGWPSGMNCGAVDLHTCSACAATDAVCLQRTTNSPEQARLQKHTMAAPDHIVHHNAPCCNSYSVACCLLPCAVPAALLGLQIRDIGSGNFGVARLCRDKTNSQLVAIKFIGRCCDGGNSARVLSGQQQHSIKGRRSSCSCQRFLHELCCCYKQHLESSYC
jgi:hypothetical protein